MIFWLMTSYRHTNVSKETATSILRVKDWVINFVQKFDNHLRVKMGRLTQETTTYIFTSVMITSDKFVVNNLSILRHNKPQISDK